MEDNKDIDDNVVRDFLKESSGAEFKVPDNYFEGFQKNIHSKINKEYKPWWKMPRVTIGVGVLTSIVLVFFVLKDFSKNVKQAQVELNKEELLAYFSDNIDEISEAEILEVIDDEGFSTPVQFVKQSDSLKTKKKNRGKR